ncbi:hypothetical protein [Vibrio phage VP16T]|nr:hypothetical protein [Vibrio phage VP16T]
MARLGQRTNAGEALAQCGEPQMQAGNFILTSASSEMTTADATLRASGEMRIIIQGTSSLDITPAVMVARAELGAPPIVIEPPGDLPRAGTRDVWMFQTVDDGNVYPVNGDLYRTDGLETAVYLSLYGGNPEDNGQDANRLGWWGNANQEEPARQMVSRFQHLVEGIPLTSGNLQRLEDAATADLEWLSELGYDVRTSGRLTGKDRLQMTINIDGDEFVITN